MVTESLGWLRVAIVALATIVVPAIGYVVRLALVQSNLRTRVETTERRCNASHSQLNEYLREFRVNLQAVGNEVSALHAKVDMLIRLNGGKGRR